MEVGGDSASGVANCRVVVPLFKKGDRRVCSNYRGDHTSQPPREGLHARVLERRIRPIVDPRFQDSGGTMRFSSRSWNSWTSSIPSTGCWRVYGSLPNQSTCVLCGSGEGIRPCPSWYSVGSAPLDQDLQHVLGRFAAECEAAGMRISTSKSEAMVLDRKRVACPLQVSGEVLPQVEEFKYLGVLFTSEGKMEREIDRRIGAASAVMRSVYRTVVVKKELSQKKEGSRFTMSIYVPTLTYGHELWGGVPGMSHREEASGRRPRTRWRDYVSRLAWERLGIPPEELEEVSGVREVWASLLRLLPPRPGPGPSG
ncbi:hypothetical protein L3Q82_011187 [Scortum barcoo]|uniref:Uncharacterized protein n=1 Tax=Scortum barcoo TaxID=214431 RepID=A0ACB8WAT9_9TELE|nr:hypothetical protein L3Q82_011187 [Scortum barcoo]